MEFIARRNFVNPMFLLLEVFTTFNMHPLQNTLIEVMRIQKYVMGFSFFQMAKFTKLKLAINSSYSYTVFIYLSSNVSRMLTRIIL